MHTSLFTQYFEIVRNYVTKMHKNSDQSKYNPLLFIRHKVNPVILFQTLSENRSQSLLNSSKSMRFHLITMILVFIITTISGRAIGKPLLGRPRKLSRVNRTIRIVGSKNTKRVSRKRFLILNSKNSLVRNYVDDVFSWLASVYRINYLGNRESFDQFLKFELRWTWIDFSCC